LRRRNIQVGESLLGKPGQVSIAWYFKMQIPGDLPGDINHDIRVDEITGHGVSRLC
jgi:hypothetical protein